jgi:addiction module HigA family antidote
MVRTSGLAAIHPGEFLAEILAELGVSQAAFARAIGVSPMRVSHVIGGSRPVTAELALLFGKALGQSPEYWLNLQSAYDLAKARSAVGARLKGMRPLPEVALARKDACLTHLARSRSKKPGITAGLFPKTDLATGHQSLTRPAANTSRTSGWSQYRLSLLSASHSALAILTFEGHPGVFASQRPVAPNKPASLLREMPTFSARSLTYMPLTARMMIKLARRRAMPRVQRRTPRQRVAKNHHVRRQLRRPRSFPLSQNLARCCTKQRNRVPLLRLFPAPPLKSIIPTPIISLHQLFPSILTNWGSIV